MSRNINSIAHTITPIVVDAAFAADPGGWLLALAQTHHLNYLLAHADDGVMWGKVDGNSLWLSGAEVSAISPPLREITLQQARLFGPSAELLVWRSSGHWSARVISDGTGQTGLYYDEKRILWGNRRPESNEAYTVTVDGEQGFKQVIPLPSSGPQFTRNKKPYRPFYLCLRHYLTQDETSGLYRVTLSRLADLNVEDAK